MDRPKMTVIVTSAKDKTIFKEFNKANGLLSLDVSGLSNTVPYYGIISRSGTLTIIDKEGWLKEQSDNNILPDVTIDIFLNGVLQYSFSSNNDISYTKQDKKVTINLSDEITALQEKSIYSDMVFSDTDGLSLFSQVMNALGLKVVMDTNTRQYLSKIVIPEIVIKKDTYWNIIQSLSYGVRGIFYKFGNNYYIKRMEE